MKVYFKFFNIRIDDSDEEAFMDRLEDLCEEYSGKSFQFNYDVEHEDIEEEDE